MRLCEDSGLGDECTFTSPSEGDPYIWEALLIQGGFGHSIHS
jgi:hypothetical protein